MSVQASLRDAGRWVDADRGLKPTATIAGVATRLQTCPLKASRSRVAGSISRARSSCARCLRKNCACSNSALMRVAIAFASSARRRETTGIIEMPKRQKLSTSWKPATIKQNGLGNVSFLHHQHPSLKRSGFLVNHLQRLLAGCGRIIKDLAGIFLVSTPLDGYQRRRAARAPQVTSGCTFGTTNHAA